MMKMKVGDYVKTKDGYIRQLQAIMTGGYLHLEDFDCEYNYIIKSSPNIIDLIEVGDYVNGNEVLEIKKFGSFNGIKVFGDIYYNEEIKTIVTKEQMKLMEYKI